MTPTPNSSPILLFHFDLFQQLIEMKYYGNPDLVLFSFFLKWTLWFILSFIAFFLKGTTLLKLFLRQFR